MLNFFLKDNQTFRPEKQNMTETDGGLFYNLIFRMHVGCVLFFLSLKLTAVLLIPKVKQEIKTKTS